MLAQPGEWGDGDLGGLIPESINMFLFVIKWKENEEEQTVKDFKAFIRKNKTFANIIVVLIGVIAIFVSVHLGTSNRQSICMSIGTSVFASGLVVLITSLFVDDGEGDEKLKQWGIEAIYVTRGEMNISCDRYMKKAKRIDVIAFGLRSWRDSQSRAIEKLLKSGCEIRILTMNPNCENLRQRERDELQEAGSISHTIKQLADWAKKLNARSYPGKIEIRYYDAQPLNFMFLMDNRLFIGPYEYGKGSQQTISYEFNVSGEAHRYYREYFNTLWENEEFCAGEFE